MAVEHKIIKLPISSWTFNSSKYCQDDESQHLRKLLFYTRPVEMTEKKLSFKEKDYVCVSFVTQVLTSLQLIYALSIVYACYPAFATILSFIQTDDKII